MNCCRLFPLMMIMACTLALPSAHAQEPTAVNTAVTTLNRMRAGNNDYFELRAEAFVTAPPQHVWKVLTDYNRLHEFVPNLLSSRIASRTGNETLIEQSGTGGVFLFQKHIRLIVRAVEQPYASIDVSLVSGDMKQYAVRWELQANAVNGVEGTRLSYTGKIEPQFFVPPLIGTQFMRTDFHKMMQAVVAEIIK